MLEPPFPRRYVGYGGARAGEREAGAGRDRGSSDVRSCRREVLPRGWQPPDAAEGALRDGGAASEPLLSLGRAWAWG